MTERPAPIGKGTERRDQGSASIWVLAASALLLVITFAIVLRGAAVLARHRAESAADLAALAAAQRIGRGGPATICATAGRIASVNHARVVGCRSQLSGDGRSGVVSVQVVMTIRLPLLGARNVTAHARSARLPPVQDQEAWPDTPVGRLTPRSKRG